VTAKRKRRRGSSRRAGAGRAGGAVPAEEAREDDEAIDAGGSSAAAEEEPTQTESSIDEGQPRARRSLFGSGQPGPYPPLGVSLAVGLRAAGSSPVILATAFLTVLAAWALFAALGFPVPPGPLAALLALPPLHVLFDAQLVQAAAEGTAVLVAISVGVVAFRAATLGLLVLLVVDGLENGTASFRRVIGRLPRVWAGLVQIYLLELALILAVPLLLESFLGPQVGQLGILLGLVFGLYFLAMAPVVAATEDLRAQDAIRVSARAARLPGLRHFGLVFLYFFLVIFVILQVSPPGLLSPATPSILVWSFVLAATIVHMGVLGAFAYRWSSVRNESALGLEETRKRARGARPAGKAKEPPKKASAAGSRGQAGASSTSTGGKTTGSGRGAGSRRSRRSR
jgi:hypothetical protein